MSLAPGQTLTHYRILGTLGVGAMGEVYRATDTRLGREVAIKVLPPRFLAEQERLVRFEREAKALASLNHPNIAQVFGIDQVDDTCFMAMELVPGTDLAARLADGPLPVDEALDVCRQIAHGLEAAHEAGVIHRDLKPANVHLTPDGRVKLLDFGLAKPMAERESGATTDSVLHTAAGRVLGTPVYMAPEQARGKPIDRRVDVWAFGCVLYECLTGKRAFGGETMTDVLGAVLHTDPDLGALPAATPRRVRELVAQCLAKDPRRRLRDCGDAALALELAGEEPQDALGPASGAPAPARGGASRALLAAAWLASLAAVAVVAVLAAQRVRKDASPPRVVRSSLVLPPGLELTSGETPFALSPDGSSIAFVAAEDGAPARLWIRRLASLVLQPLAGTEGAAGPFWSPDGASIAFLADGRLKRVALDGGGVATICSAAGIRGGTWGPDGTIVFSPGPFDPLVRVPASGGTPEALTAVTGRESHRVPHFLPDGRRVLYLRCNIERPGLHALDLATGEDVRVADGDSEGIFAPPGVLVHVRDGNLMATRFDADTLRLEGEPRLLVEDVFYNAYRHTGSYSLSAEGTLVFANDRAQRRLRWIEDDGRPGDWLGEPDRIAGFRLSPDARWCAYIRMRASGATELLVHDVERGLARKVADDPAPHIGMVWSPDGTQLVFSRRTDESFDPYVLDVASGTERAFPAEGTPASWSPDGRWLAFLKQTPTNGFDTHIAPADGSARARPLISTPANEFLAEFSPDGRWLTTLSDGSGETMLEVVAFPDPGPSWPVAPQVAVSFRWLPDGRIVFMTETGLMSVSVTAAEGSPRPLIGTPERFLEGARFQNRMFDVAPDGSRVLTLMSPDEAASRTVTLLQHWPALIEADGR